MIMPEVSFIMPLYNKSPATTMLSIAAMDSIKKFTTLPHEIILIDNASPDHGVNPQVRFRVYRDADKVIVFQENRGFGYACNEGFRLARGKYLCCMNSDAEFVEDTPLFFKIAMEMHNLDVIFPEHYENCQHYKMGKDERLMPGWYFGACWMGKKEVVWDRLQGFDVFTFPMCYWEDTDLWSRMHRAGCRLAGYRGTWVKHKGQASAIPNTSEIFLKNREAYIHRWGTDKVVI